MTITYVATRMSNTTANSFDAMAEGLQVIIKYRGAKSNRIASPATPSSEFAILKKDLAHLRVHSPSYKNVRRVDGSFILHWPTAGTSPKLAGLTVRGTVLVLSLRAS
jgi:hypothetical protein